MTLKQLTFRLKKKSAGRNSSGRITVFHRGGGSKRLHRKMDFQRNTSSIGVVQRIDYDPNRSSWIALVRWLEAMKQAEAANSQTEEKAKRFLGRREKKNFFFQPLIFVFFSVQESPEKKLRFFLCSFFFRDKERGCNFRPFR